ncbi:MAG: penicillin-binding protein 1B [Gammaproteobacteria bacterium]|nr:MAG: penicillin-binding protein 1B [Gammaproteobacteria bacterium]
MSTRRKPAAGKKSRKATPRPRRWLGMLWKTALAGLVLVLVMVAYLDAIVQRKFEGKKWALPAKVYARPLELYAGLSLPKTELLRELQALGYRQATGWQAGTFQDAGDLVHLHTRGFRFSDGVEPARHLQLQWQGNGLVALGHAAPIIRLEPLHIGGIYPAHQEDRLLVRLDDVPPLLLKTLVQVEDRNFYSHWGVSLRGIARALLVNVQSGRLAQGGSTLTQQLVKNFYLTAERSLWRKAVEAVMAVLLEVHYSKDAILETYLNEVYLGQSGPRAVHGFGLASLHYFNRPVGELELHQIALLVGIVKGPSQYNPWKHPGRALERRDLILDMLADENIVPRWQANVAKSRALDIAGSTRGGQPGYPAFIELVSRQLREEYRPQDLSSEGLEIFTAFDPRVQWQSESALAGVVAQLEQRHKLAAGTLQGAVVVTNPVTGEVQAVVGGRSPRFAGFNRALDAQRPIGSTIKPVVYLTALERGRTLATLVDDSPLQVKGPKNTVWSPRNYDKQSHGEAMLVTALANSWNQATARLGMELGVANVLATLKRLGVERTFPPLPSVLLGSVAMSPLEVATMYQTIAAGGFQAPPRAIREVRDARGRPLSRYPLALQQKASPEATFLLQYALVGAVREGTGRSVYNTLPADRVVAGKTGTTDDQRDSWFAGFTGDRLAVVWLGRDDNQPTPLTGSSGALTVWGEIMRYSEQSLDLVPPDRVQFVAVDRHSGAKTGSACPDALMLPFVKGSEPTQMAACQQEGRPIIYWLRRLVQ